MNNSTAGRSENSVYIPYFDKEAMLRLSATENGQRVFQLLAASKSQASACLDGIPTLEGMPNEIIIKITLQLLEKGWLVRIFHWLSRIMNEVPDLLSENVIALSSSDYWTPRTDSQSDMKFTRKRELFCDRFEPFYMEFLAKIEQRGVWDPKMERAYGMYLRYVRKNDIPAAKSFRTAFEMDGDAAAIVPYAQILLEKKRISLAKGVLTMGWEEFRDVESLRALTQLHFMTKNSKEAIPLYYYLKDLGEPLDGELGSHLRDYQFPRDFDAIEELGEKGLDHYLSQSYKKDLFEAIAQGLKTFEIGTPATAEYELRGLRLASIEFRNYSATQQFVTCVMGLYEGGWEKRAILRDFFEKNPMPRVQVFLKSENDEEIESSESTDDESDVSEDFKDILSAHLYLAARFALTPDRADLIQVLKDFATEHELDSLKSLMGDLSLVHTRISSIFHLLGDEFTDFYLEMQKNCIISMKGDENYFAMLIAVLEGKCALDSPAFQDYGNQVAFTMAAILYGADIEYTEAMIEMINLDFMPPIAAKQFGRLLQNCGFERYALSAFACGELYDLEVVSAMLNLAFSGNYVPEDLPVAISARPDFDVNAPIDLKMIVAELLQRNMLPNGLYPAEILTLFGETAIVYGEIRSGLTILRDAAKAGSVRAKTRIAEYYLYSVPKPKKALRMFEEIHTATKDPRFIADIARARKLLIEKEVENLPEGTTYDSSKILDLIQDLPVDHPDFLQTFLELSTMGDQATFDKACRALVFADPAQIDSLSEDLFAKFDIRMYEEIERIESLERVEWSDMSRHLFYSRTLAGIHIDNIEYTLDYLNDLLTYMEDFKIEDSEKDSRGQLHAESLSERTTGLRNAVFVQFFRQFSTADFTQEMEEFIYTLVEYDEDGKEIGILDQIVDPFIISMIFEIGYFENLLMGDKKMPKFYEFVAEIFESICQHPILAEKYEKKGRDIERYIKNAKKPKFSDESVRNSPTLLQ